jgi:hypothetical protein
MFDVNGPPNITPPAIIGELEAGKAAKTLKTVKALISGLNTSTFDLMDALYEVKTEKYYATKFDTYTAYAHSLDLKPAKSWYLVSIKDHMLLAGIDRSVYEPIGVAKLRIIAGIEMRDNEGNVLPSAVQLVQTLLTVAEVKTLNELKVDVEVAKGNVGEDAWEWLNIKIKKAAKTIVRKMLDGVKLQMGSSGKDAEGNSKDPSDGAALEMVGMDWASDPNNEAVIILLDKQAEQTDNQSDEGGVHED